MNHNTECGQIDGHKIIDIDNNTVEIRFHSSKHERRNKRGFQLEFAGEGPWVGFQRAPAPWTLPPGRWPLDPAPLILLLWTLPHGPSSPGPWTLLPWFLLSPPAGNHRNTCIVLQMDCTCTMKWRSVFPGSP